MYICAKAIKKNKRMKRKKTPKFKVVVIPNGESGEPEWKGIKRFQWYDQCSGFKSDGLVGVCFIFKLCNLLYAYFLVSTKISLKQ